MRKGSEQKGRGLSCVGAWRGLEEWLGNIFVAAHKHSHTAACGHTSIGTKVMGLQHCASTKGDTLKCHLYSWDAIYSVSLTQTHMHTVISTLSTMSCSQSTQTDMRAAGNQQSGTMSLRVSTLEELLEQQEVDSESDRSSDCTGRKAEITDGQHLLYQSILGQV